MIASEAMKQVRVGERHAIRKTVSETDVYLYAGIVGDFHPNHTDEIYAREHLGRRVAHGALLPGFVSRATVELIGDRLTPPGYAAQEFRLKMIAPVFIGDTIEVSVEVSELITERRKVLMRTEIRNQDAILCALGDTTVKVLAGRNGP
ncbi:MaoC family dehydratase [Marinovum sp. 2_MG-2023]|uniref:MaoC family dehydratase n=1 Tax=unclassified Marinovum TaxID=2647166 RepID=UPI0026E2253C|nr:MULTISPECIES: MaoC family dehydratase [unclassified Marinovum]MDO6732596.1 MaoC family dehydratase [Marinovum sp. 2_MG-2023]MDO6782087.1 MaoC family dehydratase [Marinovum sp. 1_MG-2023]